MSSTNGVANRVAGTKPAKPKSTRARKPSTRKCDGLLKWARVGVVASLGLSAGLNGMAFSQHSPFPAAGWALGFAIPGLILVFSRVSGLLWQQGRRQLGYVGAGACLSILLLSVQHCAVAISRLTGEHVLLAGLMALAIDAGLVVCELATLPAKR